MKPVISVFYQHMPPFPGGAALRGGTVATALAEAASRKGYRVHVVAAAGDAVETEGLSVRILPESDVENSASIGRRLAGELRLGWRVGRHMTRVKPAIALISSPAFLAALVAALFCRVRRIPYVLDIRDVYPQVYCEAGLLQKASVAYRLLMALSRQMYSAASRVVVVTKGLGGVVGRVAPRARATCIYNGYPGGVARYRAAKHDRYTVCFHGVMGFFQDIETLRELAFALLPHDIDVVVIGYGRKEGMLRHDVPANLRFLGRLPFGETMRQVSMCHVGLCLRLDDGISRDAFPIKVWEYLGLGMPCLVTPPCEAGAFLEEHDCGRQLGTGDVEGLRRAILELRAAPGPIDKQGWSGVSAVQGYTRERMAEAVAAVVMESLPVTPR